MKVMDSDDSLIEENIGNDTKDNKIKVYKKRWLILFVFAINSMANALLFTSVTSINDIICRYYDISPGLTDWAANSFTIIYILVALPSAYCMDNFGLRTLVLIGSSLNAICVCLHFAGSSQNGIIYVITGQFVAGFSVGAVLQVPPRLSTVWFPEHEHAKATSIAMIFNTLGLGVGFLQPSYMVPDTNKIDDIYQGIYIMNITHLVFLGVCLVLVYFFFDDKPKLPPSYAMALTSQSEFVEHINVPNFKESLLLLFTDWNFMKLAIAYGIYFGFFNYNVTCLNEMASHIVSSKSIGWLGFLGNIVSVIAIVVISSIVDRFHVYRLVSVILLLGSVLAWAAFSVTLVYWKTEVTLYITYLFVSLLAVPFFVIGIEYTSEITYPIPEGLSSAIILIIGNAFGLFSVLFLGKLVDNGNIKVMCLINFGLYVVAFVLVCLVKPVLKRSGVEKQHQEEEKSIVNSNIET